MKQECYSDIARFEIGKKERGPKLSGQINLVSLVVLYFSVSPAALTIPSSPRRRLRRRRRLTPAERQSVSLAPN